MRKKEFFKWIGFICVLFVLIMTICLTLSVIFNNSDLLGMTSPTQRSPHVFHLVYPQSTSQIDVFGNNQTILSTSIALQYSGPLVEGTKVNVSAAGFVYPKGRDIVQNLTLVDQNTNQISASMPYYAVVGFSGASVYNYPEALFPTPEGEFPINLATDTDRLSFLMWDSSNPWPQYQSIMWDLEGDYYPILSVSFKNGTTDSVVYTDKLIHVGGSDVVRQERYAKVSTLLTLALFALTIVTSMELLFKLRPKIISDFIGL
jgi:hypothetical protein